MTSSLISSDLIQPSKRLPFRSSNNKQTSSPREASSSLTLQKPQHQRQQSQSSYIMKKPTELSSLLGDSLKLRRRAQDPAGLDNNITNILLLMRNVLLKLNSRIEQTDAADDRLTSLREDVTRDIRSPLVVVSSVPPATLVDQDHVIQEKVEYLFNNRMKTVWEKLDLNVDSLRNSIERLKLLEESLHDKTNLIIDKLENMKKERQQSQEELRTMVDSMEKVVEQGAEEAALEETVPEILTSKQQIAKVLKQPVVIIPRQTVVPSMPSQQSLFSTTQRPTFDQLIQQAMQRDVPLDENFVLGT
ncbi:unnamed protein product [Didymodactylos carnosus]|uniref:Uncharacterized protein n=1 Tax=Didymodactylos carnosus TaxID=1234261 RepID=A0A8S2CUS1_9BILA|nr:unnamed protein product [Didymodactylos carnosus]CAF3546799.1 unnamed protein product [Didymodactylos carnosus]